MSRVIRPKTLIVNVPLNGTPVPLLYQTGRYPFVIRTDRDIRIGSQDSLNVNQGLFLEAGSVFGMGAADYGDMMPLGQLYVVSVTGSGAKVEGIYWTEERK